MVLSGFAGEPCMHADVFEGAPPALRQLAAMFLCVPDYQSMILLVHKDVLFQMTHDFVLQFMVGDLGIA